MSYNNINDTDDAKAQVPTFLMETPFDTSVTRRVKRAYSSLDAISVRTGVFLRRYPLARILVLFYMVSNMYMHIYCYNTNTATKHNIYFCRHCSNSGFW